MIEPCPLCGTWVCFKCKWTRQHADRTAKQACPKCGGRVGKFIPTRHHHRVTLEDHTEEYERRKKEQGQ